MLPDRVSNPGPLTFESGALPIALRSPANHTEIVYQVLICAIIAGLVSLAGRPIAVSAL